MASSSTQPFVVPEPEVKEAVHPLPEPKPAETPFVIRLIQIVPC